MLVMCRKGVGEDTGPSAGSFTARAPPLDKAWMLCV